MLSHVKEFYGLLQSRNKAVNFVLGVVDVETRTCACIDAKMAVEWLRTVVAGSDGDTFCVQNHGNVSGMEAIDIKGR